MNRRALDTRPWLLPGAVVLSLLAGAPHAQAIAPLTLTLDHSAQTVLPGGTLTFTGTVANTTFNSEELSFGGDSLNPIGPWPAGLTLDDTPFLTDAPATLDPSFPYTGDLFTVSVAPGTPLGTYDGTFQVEYDNAFGTPFLAAQGFEVTVGPAPVPEASTTVSFSLLLVLGLGGVVIAAKKKKARAAV